MNCYMVSEFPIVEEEVIPEGLEVIHQVSVFQQVRQHCLVDHLHLGPEWDHHRVLHEHGQGSEGLGPLVLAVVVVAAAAEPEGLEAAEEVVLHLVSADVGEGC